MGSENFYNFFLVNVMHNTIHNYLKNKEFEYLC